MKFKTRLKKLYIVPIFIGILYIGFLQYQIHRHANIEVPKNADYMIILGARVKGTEPSLALRFRIDFAAKYLQENPKTVAIASGGRGAGEDISEAESIKRELISQGIAETRILLEDKSTDTYENIMYSKKVIPDGADRGLVVTNDFHIYRATMIAEKGNLNISGLPAKTPIQAVFKSYTREYLALTKYFILTPFR